MAVDAGTVGAVVGIGLGVIGGIIGTAVSLRRARSDSERRCIVKWATALSLVISSFVIGLRLVPKEHSMWVHGAFMIALTAALRAATAEFARFEPPLD